MKATKSNIEAISSVIARTKARSAWAKGVKTYAGMLLENLAEYADYYESAGEELPEITEELMLNGAKDWNRYSYGGNAFVYECEIAEALCSPSKLKSCKGGERRPNRFEDWLDVQARALWQASLSIKKAMMFI